MSSRVSRNSASTVRLYVSERSDLMKTRVGTGVPTCLPGEHRSSAGKSMQTSTTLTQSQTDLTTGELVKPSVYPITPVIDPLALFRNASVITVLGRVENWTLEWAGRIRCSLRLSIGELPLTGNRDTLPLEINNGSWVRARVLLRRGSPGSATRLLSVTTVRPKKSDPTASWLPTSQYHRHAHMHRLRLLLSQLEPGLQAIFMAVMVDAKVQLGFLNCIAAGDHHTYPGGLFDQSIEAAELAYQQEHLGPRDRGIAALACLLFDLGKVSDDQFRPDRSRCGLGLEPHVNTMRHIARTLDSVARFEPDLVASLRMLLKKCDWTEWLSAPGIALTLKQCVHQVLQDSWQFDQPINDSTNTGAQK